MDFADIIAKYWSIIMAIALMIWNSAQTFAQHKSLSEKLSKLDATLNSITLDNIGHHRTAKDVAQLISSVDKLSDRVDRLSEDMVERKSEEKQLIKKVENLFQLFNKDK